MCGVVCEVRRKPWGVAIEMCSEEARHKWWRRDSERRAQIGPARKRFHGKQKHKTGEQCSKLRVRVAGAARKTTSHSNDGTLEEE